MADSVTWTVLRRSRPYAPGAAAGGGGDPYWANVEFLIANETGKADGNTSFVDQSSNAFTVSVSDTAQWDTGITPPSGLDASVLISSATAGLSIPDNAATELGTSDFTLEGLVYFTSLVSQGTIVVKGAWTGGNPAFALFADSGNFYYSMSSDGVTNDIANFPIILASPSTATWYYWAIKRSGTAITSAYKATPVSGQSTTAGGGATSSASVWNSTTGWFFGYDTNSGNMVGNFACVRLTVGVARDISTVPSMEFPTS